MSEGEESVLTPTVLWAQRKNLILLRVQFQPVEKPDFTIREDYMSFKGMGVGMSGKSTFAFELVFFEPVMSDKCRVKFFENEIEFRLLKKEENVWPRLQSSQERPHWIRIDFEHWEYQQESGEEEEEEEGEDEGEGAGQVDPEKLERLKKTKAQMDELETVMKEQEEKYKYIVGLLEKVKVAYLLVYNGVQWSGFILIVLTLLKCLAGGMDQITTAYEKTASMLIFCHLLMLLEIGHSLLGLVKGGFFPTFLQVFGRFLILIVVLRPAEEIHDHPIVFLLFLVWSLIEIIRYPYYAMSVLNLDVKYLTWLRYTAWIPLYPVGFTCEATVTWLSIPHFDSSGDFQYLLPNPLNISIYPPAILRVALFIIPFIAFNQITHMFAQRKNKLAKLKTA